MCMNCGSTNRRNLFKFGASGLMALGLGVSRASAASYGSPTALTADEALAALKQGNSRFMSEPDVCTVELAAIRKEVAPHQAPWATIIACADSRVPPELIFGGLGLGELFVARNAGNLVDTGTMGTVEYGQAVLGSPLIVVLAHTNCGAVAAACDVVLKNATFPGAIGKMINPIIPAALAVRDKAGDYVTNAAKESAKRTAAQLTAGSSLIAKAAESGKVKIVSAIYDLKSGKVDYLD